MIRRRHTSKERAAHSIDGIEKGPRLATQRSQTEDHILSPSKTSAKTTGATRTGAAKTAAKKAGVAKKLPKAPPSPDGPALLSRILTSLDDDKAEQIVTIDMDGRSSLADAIVIATGRSARHVTSIGEHLARRLKEAGYGNRPIGGLQGGDWVVVDAGDVIVHIFRPEVRTYYDLEGMWSVEEPRRAQAH
ncbi:MAG: ribosome silencing factor [Rhizomicrobium sp.]